MRKLTLKEQRFIKHYIETGNGAEAVRRAGYQLGSKNGSKTLVDAQETASSIATENLRKPSIAQAINKAIIKERITPEYVLKGIDDIANTPDNKPSDRLRAYELLGKSLRLFGIENNENKPTNIVIQLGNSAETTKIIATEEAEQVKNTIQANSSQ